MKTAAELLRAYAKPLCTVPPEATVFDALHILAKHGLGALPVIDAQGKLVGIVSERDYTRKVALQGKNSRETPVLDIMTREVLVSSFSQAACLVRSSFHTKIDLRRTSTIRASCSGFGVKVTKNPPLGRSFVAPGFTQNS